MDPGTISGILPSFQSENPMAKFSFFAVVLSVKMAAPGIALSDRHNAADVSTTWLLQLIYSFIQTRKHWTNNNMRM